MADYAQWNDATTPLAGTEQAVIFQNGHEVKTAVSNFGGGGTTPALLVESGSAVKISALPPASHPLSVLDTSEGVPGIQKDGDDDLVDTFLSRFNLLGAPLTNSTGTVFQNDGMGTTNLLGLEYCYIVAGSNIGNQILQLADIASNYVPSVNPSGAEYTIVTHGQTGDSVQIVADADDNINWGALDGDNGGSLTTTTNGSLVTLAADGSAHTWYVKSWEGTWTQTTSGGSRIISDQGGGGGVVVAVAGAATVNARAGTIQSEALTGATTYSLTLTNSYITTGPPASTVIVNLTDSAGAAVTLLTKTVANGHVTVTMSMAALTGHVNIDFAVFN